MKTILPMIITAFSISSYAQVRTTVLNCQSKSASVQVNKEVDYNKNEIRMKAVIMASGCVDHECGNIEANSIFEKLSTVQADPKSFSAKIEKANEKVTIQLISSTKGFEGIPGTALALSLKSSNTKLPLLILKGNLLETSGKTFMKANLFVGNGSSQVLLGAETMACTYSVND